MVNKIAFRSTFNKLLDLFCLAIHIYNVEKKYLVF